MKAFFSGQHVAQRAGSGVSIRLPWARSLVPRQRSRFTDGIAADTAVPPSGGVGHSRATPRGWHPEAFQHPDWGILPFQKSESHLHSTFQDDCI